VSKLATKHMLMPILSRLMSRGARARHRVRVAGSRVLAGFSAAVILIGSQSAVRIDRQSAAETVRVAPHAAAVPALPALHSVAPCRVALESHSPSPSRVREGAALPAYAQAGLAARISSDAVTIGAIANHGGSVVSRGYDATAPPALS
jgi:hypothetical protein